MIQHIDINSTPRDIVTNDFRAATILKKNGINFCCGGGITLKQACSEKGIDTENLVSKLKEVVSLPVIPSQNFNDWKLDFLTEYIKNTHHKYVMETSPEIEAYTIKISGKHGTDHPELLEVAGLFAQLKKELMQHLQYEEEILFPAIKEAFQNKVVDSKTTISSEIDRMRDNHEFTGGLMKKINELTSGYLVPDGACNSYLVSLKLLQQFEEDLYTHIHLENNILFPKALRL